MDAYDGYECDGCGDLMSENTGVCSSCFYGQERDRDECYLDLLDEARQALPNAE